MRSAEEEITALWQFMMSLNSAFRSKYDGAHFLTSILVGTGVLSPTVLPDLVIMPVNVGTSGFVPTRFLSWPASLDCRTPRGALKKRPCLSKPNTSPLAIMAVLEMVRQLLRLLCMKMISNGHVLRTLDNVLELKGAPRTEKFETGAINHLRNSFKIPVHCHDFHPRMVPHDALQSLLSELLLELTCNQECDPLLHETANTLQRSYGLE